MTAGLPKGEARHIDADTPILEVLPIVLDSPAGFVDVDDNGIRIGSVSRDSLLEGLGRFIAPRDDCSTITVECRPEDYSASLLAHAVEDSDAHLVDLVSTPGRDGMIKVTLRVRCSDPSAAIHNLERYDFRVVDSYSSANVDAMVAAERLLALKTLLNI